MHPNDVLVSGQKQSLRVTYTTGHLPSIPLHLTPLIWSTLLIGLLFIAGFLVLKCYDRPAPASAPSPSPPAQHPAPSTPTPANSPSNGSMDGQTTPEQSYKPWRTPPAPHTEYIARTLHETPYYMRDRNSQRIDPSHTYWEASYESMESLTPVDGWQFCTFKVGNLFMFLLIHMNFEFGREPMKCEIFKANVEKRGMLASCMRSLLLLMSLYTSCRWDFLKHVKSESKIIDHTAI